VIFQGSSSFNWAHLSPFKCSFLSGALGADNGEGYFCGFAFDYGSVTRDFFVANFLHFVKNILQTDSLSQVPWSIEFFWPKYDLKKSPKIAFIAYNMKGCLRFSTFIYHQMWLNILTGMITS